MFGNAKGPSAQFTSDAQTIGRMLGAARGHRMIYGGGRTGLMGAVSGGALEAGGHVHGIIPHFLENLEIGNQQIQKLDVVESMHERKPKCMLMQMVSLSCLVARHHGRVDGSHDMETAGMAITPVFVMNTDGYGRQCSR